MLCLRGGKSVQRTLKDKRNNEKRVSHILQRLMMRSNYKVKKSARLKNAQICFKVESTAKPNESTA